MPRPVTTPWADARNSAIHGRGLYAKVLIPEGTRIIEYQGERITKAEAERREKVRVENLAAGRDACVWIFILNKTHDIDGAASWNTARLINHSCEPNCRSEIIRGHIWIIAKREIQPGEELSFDYGYSFTEWRKHPCLCGSKTCAGFIVAKSQRWRLRRALREEKLQARRVAAASKKRTGGPGTR